MLSKTFSATQQGLDGQIIEVEAAKQRSIPQIHITGLPGEIIKESRERVRACLLGLGFEVPSARIVVHLSPANARKQGSQFDLAIAMSVLMAENLLPEGSNLNRLAFLGELTLDGRIQRVSGAVALIEALEKSPSIATIFIPRANAFEAGLVNSTKARLVNNVAELIRYLSGTHSPHKPPSLEQLPLPAATMESSLDAVIGQNVAKRALQISLAGRHHLLLVGPPGVGKSMLASCAPGLLPPLSPEELVEVVKNRSHLFQAKDFDFKRPFRSPHHSISGAALLGGGSGMVIPGEVTLAHSGVLFLDEFPEFRRDVVEGIREPLQTGIIHLHRVGQALSLPARFTLISAMNPCPCGYSLGQPARCSCSVDKVRAYRRRISGPVMDRIDLCVMLDPPKKASSPPAHLTQAESLKKIRNAIKIQNDRYGYSSAVLQNGDVGATSEQRHFDLAVEEKSWFERLIEKEALSYRGISKVLKVARTIADLAEESSIKLEHLQEAWSLRCQNLPSSVFGF